jgi:predicted metal-dependent hydrolase
MKGWLARFRRKTAKPPPPARLLHVAPATGGTPIAVALKRSPRARRLVLTVDPGLAQPRLVIPPFVSIGEAQAFLDSRAAWLVRRLRALPPRAALGDGAAIPFLGGVLTLRHAPEARGIARRGDVLHVAGDPRHLSRRAVDWLKRAAREEFAVMAAAKAAEAGRPRPRVMIRDPKRQWGSCSADGVLRLSWRLVLAPRWVAEYVIAHEVAHLIEMNHGRAFWAAVRGLTPRMDEARLWLKRNGNALLRFG